ncbi:hypothetical protein ACRAWD_09890 [Caulobacter segnis]
MTRNVLLEGIHGGFFMGRAFNAAERFRPGKAGHEFHELTDLLLGQVVGGLVSGELDKAS